MEVMSLPEPLPGKKLITPNKYLETLFNKMFRECWQGLPSTLDALF
jgi:hypothetical protein